ncbi:Hypothetical protein OINT_1002209 [Brucella intermedia LMG 3301]|uniref:Uncharacterized protein n=1 Tax=Brucella intermedia LMG 3301 TaxID=641118 RepID=C4WJ42_9HYPH|nr:Hypothetical protein OINT_1002209 [Brucella intermedia LMG 3301]
MWRGFCLYPGINKGAELVIIDNEAGGMASVTSS